MLLNKGLFKTTGVVSRPKLPLKGAFGAPRPKKERATPFAVVTVLHRLRPDPVAPPFVMAAFW